MEPGVRTVATKFAKAFRTVFMPVCEAAQRIVAEWVVELRDVHMFGPNDPLPADSDFFPASGTIPTETPMIKAGGPDNG